MHIKESPPFPVKISKKTAYAANLGQFRELYKKEIIQLMSYELDYLNLPLALKKLQDEVDFSLVNENLALIHRRIANKEFTELLKIVESSELVEPSSLKKAQYLIHEQIVHVMLADQNQVEALQYIRKHLSPLCTDQSSIKALTVKVMQPNYSRHKGDSELQSGEHSVPLFENLQSCFYPNFQGSNNQLVYILLRHLKNMESSCYYHNPVPLSIVERHSMSLLRDHACAKEETMPLTTFKTLAAHNDEVWIVLYSFNGKRVVSIAKDSTLIIWDTADYSIIHQLQTNSQGQPTLSAAWSPDANFIVIGSNDTLVSIIDAKTGKIITTVDKHKDPVRKVAWLPCGNKFLSVGNKSALYLWEFKSNNKLVTLCHTWPAEHYIDLAVSVDGQYIYAAIQFVGIKVITLSSLASVYLQMEGQVVSLSVSKNGHDLLVCLRHKGLYLYSIPKKRFSQKYFGFTQGTMSVDPQFGGTQDQFVVSGSEDGNVFIWHTITGKLIDTIKAHSSPVSCVAWDPQRPAYLISGSDDKSIKVWSPLNHKL